MNNHLKEQLLGYLLDALDDDERQRVEEQLEADPSLIDELQLLRRSLEPLVDDVEEFDPPAGLAQRACSRVEALREREPVKLPGQDFHATLPGAIGSRSRVSVADVVVTAGIVLAAVLIFFPAIASSRYASRLKHCQNNLRQLGIALVNYSDKLGGGFFPGVASEGNRAFAGVYAPTLIDTGYLDSADKLICPASLLAELRPAYRIPTLDEIDNATPETINVIHQRAGGSYGYSLGVIAEGTHVALRNHGRPNFPLMSDAPNTAPLDDRSRNHAGRGQNFLYEDGHFTFTPFTEQSITWLDHPFRNRHGNVEAGVDENDAVIAASCSPPFIRTISTQPRR